HTVLRTDELVVSLHDGVGRQGKSRTGVSVRVGENCGVDPDHFATHVHQRPTRVARINRRISLNERLELPVRNNVAPLSRNNPSGYGFLQTEGAAYGQYPIAYLHAIGIPQLGDRKRLARFNSNDSQIGFLIGADDFRDRKSTRLNSSHLGIS